MAEKRVVVSLKKGNFDDEFSVLMRKVNDWLNTDATNRPDYYRKRDGNPLEEDVYDAIVQKAKRTVFEGTVKLVSRSYFPDIVANKYYGVEVKSTKKDKWVSTGSSILESTRNKDVERIYMTFGKLGGSPAFITKPYEDCLSEIVVTHYPRYLINMKLEHGNTIFDKMGIGYNELRLSEEPAIKVIEYYRQKAKQGHALLWWMGVTEADIEKAVSPFIKMWTELHPREKRLIAGEGMAYFPEIFKKSSPDKFNKLAAWMCNTKSVINTNIRDMFSAGGQVELNVGGERIAFPQIVNRAIKYKDIIIHSIHVADKSFLKEHWGMSQLRDNLMESWLDIVADNLTTYDIERTVVKTLLEQSFRE
ncbi:hypothetical protein [Dialister invisus]|uniref:hypothetical protein n=1 Tax=Dialister invisus TaxID=218538 RepID=UPI002670D63A|nr:hypothetical protein [Dialister invisus]